METDTHKVVTKAIKGNKKAFEKLVRQHYEQIYRTAYLYVHNEEDALDVVQEATYQAFKSIHSLKHPEYFTTWLTKIVIRCSAQLLKRKSNFVPINDEILSNLSMPTTVDHVESMQLLAAIQELRESHRTAIILFYYYDYSIKMVSELMEIPESTVKTYLSRGKAELKKSYTNKGDESHG